MISLAGDGVVIEDGFFSWSNDGPPSLQRINVKLRTGSLVAVVGHVGSGKSSLLSAILGEMERRSGFISIKVTMNNIGIKLVVVSFLGPLDNKFMMVEFLILVNACQRFIFLVWLGPLYSYTHVRATDT